MKWIVEKIEPSYDADMIQVTIAREGSEPGNRPVDAWQLLQMSLDTAREEAVELIENAIGRWEAVDEKRAEAEALCQPLRRHFIAPASAIPDVSVLQPAFLDI